MADGTDARPACLIADRAYDSDAFRAGRDRKGIEAVIPAQPRRATPGHAAWAGSKGDGAAIATINTAHRCLGFLCLAATWIYLDLAEILNQHDLARFPRRVRRKKN